MRAGVDEHRASRRDPDLRRLDERDAAGRRRRGRAGAEATQLDPCRDADAQVLALLARLSLPLADVVVARKLERAVERLLVVARVDHQPEVLGEGELLGL